MSTVALKKKKHSMREMGVKIYLGQNEVCSPEDSTSESSERLLQRGQGHGPCICDFGEGEVHAIKHLFHKSFSVSQEGLMSS